MFSTIILLFGSAATVAKASSIGAATDRPNFLFFLSESLDGRLLREDSPAKIPNIRALLASGSVRFDAGYSNNPVCAPSRASMWSGRAPHRIPHEHNGFLVNGAWNNYEGLPVNYSSRLDQLLNASGYASGVFGKTDWTVGAHTLSCRLASITFNVNWPYDTSSSGGWNQEDEDCVDFTVAPGGSGGAAGSQYAGDWKTMAQAADWAARAPEPVFAFAGTSILHPPYRTDSHWYDIAAEQAVPVVPPLDAMHPCHLQASMKHGCLVPEFNNATRIAAVRRVYLAELEEFDAMVGAAVATLAQSGRLNRTMIILSADHGDMQQVNRLFYKMVPYDGSARVPFIWASPSLGAARVVYQPVQLLDVFPTVLNMANIAVPEYADGFDLAPFLSGGAATDAGRPPYVLSQNHDEDISQSWFLVMNGTHKLIQYGTGREVPPQLFDLSADPDELNDLAPLRPDAVAALDAQLRSLIDYPAVALDVGLYQKQQLRYWVSQTPDWETEIAAQRWSSAWEASPHAALAAVKAYLADDNITLQPCNGALSNP